MAFTEEIQVGFLTTLANSNTAYALPPCIVHITSSAAIEVGLSTGTTGWNTLTNANTIGAFCSAAFVRSTTGTTTVVMVKKF